MLRQVWSSPRARCPSALGTDAFQSLRFRRSPACELPPRVGYSAHPLTSSISLSQGAVALPTTPSCTSTSHSSFRTILWLTTNLGSVAGWPLPALPPVSVICPPSQAYRQWPTAHDLHHRTLWSIFASSSRLTSSISAASLHTPVWASSIFQYWPSIDCYSLCALLIFLAVRFAYWVDCIYWRRFAFWFRDLRRRC